MVIRVIERYENTQNDSDNLLSSTYYKILLSNVIQ